MQKSAEIFWQTSPDIYSIDNIAQSSFFYTVIWLTIIMSHHYLPIQIINFFLKLINIIGKITLFCISICIMKHLKQKTQNNWFLTQIIVQGSPLIRAAVVGWDTYSTPVVPTSTPKWPKSFISYSILWAWSSTYLI